MAESFNDVASSTTPAGLPPLPASVKAAYLNTSAVMRLSWSRPLRRTPVAE
jgi:hypothetical protein